MDRLMIVDDEAVITTQLEGRLKSMEYDVVGTASSAEEAVSMARELCPDLILMDIVMKGKLDGIDAANVIKADMDIPIIFLTAYADDKFVKRARRVEPFGYIVKPFKENEIRANIEISLYRKDLERKQKRAEERIHRLFLAIEHNPYMIMIIDIEGNIEFVNKKFSQITNYTPDEIVGRNIRLLQSDEITSEVYKEMRKKILSGEEWRGELCIRKKDGMPSLKYTVALPVKNINGDIVCFILIKDEAIKRKKREEKLFRSEKLNAMRTITAGVAHEFNNILAVIHGSAELLEGGYEDEEQLNKGLRSIMMASDAGAGIVSRMITIAKSDKDTAGYIFFNIRHLIREAIDITMSGRKNIASAKRIDYQIDKEGMKEIPEVFCDPTELREMFINIINNALDAMPDGGRISLSTWRNDGSVFVSISDTGDGMSEEVKMKIFDPFFTTRRPQRTGLGMSIVYSVIARHDGRIEVNSELGKATTITMCIPIKKETEQQKLSSRPNEGFVAKGLRVLVVDDEEDICDILDKYFSRAGHIVKTVGNGTEAIELTKREDFDLVLCDLAMPGVTGYDVIRVLNDLDKKPKIGLITGDDREIKSVEQEALKFDFIIKKPFKLLALASKINALFDDA
jgi:PAS domain S-box-containing protein